MSSYSHDKVCPFRPKISSKWITIIFLISVVTNWRYPVCSVSWNRFAKRHRLSPTRRTLCHCVRRGTSTFAPSYAWKRRPNGRCQRNESRSPCCPIPWFDSWRYRQLTTAFRPIGAQRFWSLFHMCSRRRLHCHSRAAAAFHSYLAKSQCNVASSVVAYSAAYKRRKSMRNPGQ